MIRKSILAFCAVSALSAVALAPTSASALTLKPGWGWGGGWGHHHFHGVGFGFYGPRYIDVAPACYYVKRYNRFGEPRLVRVCS